MMIMIRDEGYKKFENPILQPLMKVKVSADEIKLIFNPITYVHLANISKCFSSTDCDSPDSERGKILER